MTGILFANVREQMAICDFDTLGTVLTKGSALGKSRNANGGRKMKVLVYGAGPLGSLFAARLCEAGHEVSLLASGHCLSDLRK